MNITHLIDKDRRLIPPHPGLIYQPSLSIYASSRLIHLHRGLIHQHQ